MNLVVDLIDGLPPERQDALNDYLMNAPKWLLESLQIVRIEKKTSFIRENDPAETVYILVDGIVKATDYRIQGIAYDYTRFFPIETFGAMEFFIGYKQYKTTLITETDCCFFRLSKANFAKWMLTDPHAVLLLTRATSEYLLQQVRKERLFLFLPGEERLFLLFMEVYQKTKQDGVSRIKLMRKDLSGSTGLCIKTVNRCIKQMEADGYISREKRDIVIDREQYERIRSVVAKRVDILEGQEGNYG